MKHLPLLLLVSLAACAGQPQPEPNYTADSAQVKATRLAYVRCVTAAVRPLVDQVPTQGATDAQTVGGMATRRCTAELEALRGAVAAENGGGTMALVFARGYAERTERKARDDIAAVMMVPPTPGR